jgi:SAM-dependent methyltransferase
MNIPALIKKYPNNSDLGAAIRKEITNARVVDVNSNLIGGEFEVERNEKENYKRIERVDKMAAGIPKEEVRILDFGCGNGYFIEDLKKAGYKHVVGYDAYNPIFSRLPEKDSFHIVTAVEVCEHFSYPFVEMDVIHRSLVGGGAAYIETGFTNIPVEDGISVEEYFYLNPAAGHSTVYSHHGLDILMMSKGFHPSLHFDRHCRLYKKK